MRRSGSVFFRAAFSFFDGALALALALASPRRALARRALGRHRAGVATVAVAVRV
jgi:hypothetical protein